MTESERQVVITFDETDWTYLELQAEELALTETQVVAMLVRKARKAYERPPAPVRLLTCPAHADVQMNPAGFCPDCLAEENHKREIAEKRARLQAELAALEHGQITPSDILPIIEPPNEIFGLPEFDESLLRMPEPDPFRSVVMPSSAAPGTLTGPVGVRRDLKGGDVMGDPRMNVIRRNFKHLGAG